MPTASEECQSAVNVKYRGSTVSATFVSWSTRYPGYANVSYMGKNLIRRVTAHQAVNEPVAEPELIQFPINERFCFITQLTEQVISGFSNGLIITGSGGLGKTYTVMRGLEDNDLGDADYCVIKGHATALSLYLALYRNNNKIVVFDDCDAVLDDKTSVNLLKAALDTSDHRIMSWLSSREMLNGTPTTFEFNGRIIFISNKKLKDVPQPVLSRCLFVDVTMTTDEKIERITSIMDNIAPEVNKRAKLEVLGLIKQHVKLIADLNVRTFIKTCNVYTAQHEAGNDWKRLAIYLLTTNNHE